MTRIWGFPLNGRPTLEGRLTASSFSDLSYPVCRVSPSSVKLSLEWPLAWLSSLWRRYVMAARVFSLEPASEWLWQRLSPGASAQVSSQWVSLREPGLWRPLSARLLRQALQRPLAFLWSLLAPCRRIWVERRQVSPPASSWRRERGGALRPASSWQEQRGRALRLASSWQEEQPA